MPFIITAVASDGPRTATRVLPASAIVLAMRWAKEGVQNIQIAPPNEDPRPLRIFREQHFGANLVNKA